MEENQTGAVSEEGTVSKEGEVSGGTESKEASPLTAEQASKMIADALAEQDRQYGKKLQSLTDQSAYLKSQLAEAKQKGDVSHSTLETLKGRVREADPDLLKDVEAAELKTKLSQYERSESDMRIQSQVMEFDKKFHNQLGDLLDGFDIDPADERIDWGTDAKDYLDKQGRIIASLKKIRVEDKKKEKVEQGKKFDDFKLSLRKELGLDSVDTSNPVAPKEDTTKYTPNDWIRKGLKTK